MADEQSILDQYNRKRLESANQRVRDSLSAEMPVSAMAERMSPDNTDAGLEMLGAMSIAETHNLRVGESL